MIFVVPSIFVVVVAILELEALSLACVENLCRLRFPRGEFVAALYICEMTVPGANKRGPPPPPPRSFLFHVNLEP
ncbi:hypothetical protein VNO80_20039 [Phaseolus coccineus]|uniref:Secreted protein n=1 Tax=Phaseolus coccineus TaxID=3886 RepID=A0AAN9R1B1_PHACN